jgi:endonuclease G
MTKREDPQWGSTAAEAKAAAKSTFHFCNCCPQVADLNQQEWKLLEDYILDKESVPDKLFINVFTGPVLKTDDPIFVSAVNDEDVLIPTLFWKVVYYSNDGKKLSKVGFLMGQGNLLKQRGIIKPQVTKKFFAKHLPEAAEHFNNFKDAQTYQVSLSTIEKLSGLKFPAAKQPYKDPRPIPLVIKAVEMKEDLPQAKTKAGVKKQALSYANYRYKGIVLR